MRTVNTFFLVLSGAPWRFSLPPLPTHQNLHSCYHWMLRPSLSSSLPAVSTDAISILVSVLLAYKSSIKSCCSG